MFFVVLLISLLVHYYSTEYSGHDPFLIRFLGYLSLFTFLMLVLVGSANYLQLFLGWEGVGLASYLLINFWFTRIQANKSAMKAMIINRFGDIGLYLAILLVLYFFNTTESIILEGLVEQCNNMECFIINLIVFLIFIGAVGKSAQIGLHT